MCYRSLFSCRFVRSFSEDLPGSAPPPGHFLVANHCGFSTNLCLITVGLPRDQGDGYATYPSRLWEAGVLFSGASQRWEVRDVAAGSETVEEEAWSSIF
jgi:hypothetical protein